MGNENLTVDQGNGPCAGCTYLFGDGKTEPYSCEVATVVGRLEIKYPGVLPSLITRTVVESHKRIPLNCPNDFKPAPVVKKSS